MLDVCKIISQQLELLQVKEIRNVQTAIFYKEKGTYMNYEYYAKHDKTFITETSFTNSEIHTAFAAQMMRGTGEFFSTNLNEKEVKEWIAYQKTTNVFIDDFLYNTTSLNYYWYSLGAIALGISTYVPLEQNDTNLFNRFVKVFELAYRRYLDIEKAEAQAREAQIELALERVRARTMAMQHSEELAEVSFLLDSQVRALGIKTRGCAFNIYGENESTEWFSSEAGTMPTYKTPRENVFLRYYEAGQSGETIYIEEFADEVCTAHYNYLCTVLVMGDALNEMIANGGSFPVRQIDHVVYFKYGYLLFITLEPVPEAHDIFKRFGKVFEQTYTRFLDLQKAEAQAKEANIETALEKVRSLSLVMHKSDELNEVVAILFEKLKELKIPFTAVGIGIYINGSKDLNAFVCGENEGGLVITNYRLPYFNHKIAKDFNKARTEQLEFFIGHYSKEEKDAFYTYVLEHTPEFRHLPDDIKRMIFESPSYTITMVAVNHALFNINDFEGKTLSENEVDIIKRFARVFDQAYTRFLDLQKAEVQAREAKIELALERVRARAMAMQKSEELTEAAQLLYYEFGTLGINTFTCGYVFIKDEKNIQTAWVVLPDGTLLPNFIDFPLTGDHVMDNRYKAWKEKQPLHVCKIQGEVNKEHHRFLANHVTSNVADDFFSHIPDPVIFYSANFSEGYLFIIASELFSPDEEQTIVRFAKVFEMTYTRFNDLKQAEAQAREAQIETALERVRSKTMAMHNSTDVGETVATMFNQLVHLGITTNRCGILIFSETNITEVWTAKQNSSGEVNLIIGHLDVAIHPMLTACRIAWKKSEQVFTFEMKDDEVINYYTAINNYPNYPTRFNIVSLPSKENFAGFFFADGAVFAFTDELILLESSQIFKRFANVFGQTYRRFLDLQKAETQAREAQIETALERVRSRTMAMYRSDELALTIKILFEEFRKLQNEEHIGNNSRGFITTINEEKKCFELWITEIDGSEINKQFFIGFEEETTGKFIYDAWLTKQPYLICDLQGETLNKWLDYLAQTGFKIAPGIYGTRRINNFIYYSKGFIGITSSVPLSENSIHLLQRFAKVFEQTYTRFLDLKNAEAREVIAVREASLDRVRGEIASMRTAEDLQRITPLVWRELTALGVPFFRCGLFIVDEPAEVIHFYLSTPDGKPLAALELPFQGINVTKEAIANWRLQKVYTTHWSKEEFIAFANNLLDQGQIKNTSTYLGGSEAPESLTLQFVPFKQGMLYVGSENVLNELQIESVKALANAFSTAYARYEDFIKLESAKQQIEKTLEELKTTQKQLIQSEKMASLGELTAGIAHEIQNPLNFVNNFSEVSTELLDEMNEEIAKGNLEDAKQIAEDLKQNLQKINHHGKRAGDIVKGMLQHSRNTSNTTKEPTDINKLADEYLRLAYHGLRAKDKSFNATMKTNFDESLSADEAGIGNINIIPQDIGRVILNLITNAFYAVNEKKKSGIEGYEPTVSLSTKKENNKVLITVKDNGNGIPKKILDKIFQPFFTTKPTGQGTGLGLSLSYDIVKAHGGELKVETKEGEGSTFTIQLPLQ